MVERKEARAGEQLAASINRMGRKRKGLFRKPLFRRPEEGGTQKYALKEGEGGRPTQRERGELQRRRGRPSFSLEPFPKGEFVFSFIPRDIPRKGRAAPATTRSHISLALGKILPERGKRKEAMEEEVSLPSSYPLSDLLFCFSAGGALALSSFCGFLEKKARAERGGAEGRSICSLARLTAEH